MSQLFTNNASGTLSVQAEIVDTTLTLQVGEGALFPSPSGADFFKVSLEDTGGLLEICTCTSRTGDVLTVTRAQEGTSAKVYPTGSRVEIRMTAGTLGEFIQQSGDAMTGELDMAGNILRDPLITDGEARNMPLRGSDGGTSNEIVVPTAGGAPTLGGDTILTTPAANALYALITRLINSGEGLTGGGDLSANRTLDLDLPGLAALVVDDLAADDSMLVYDTSASEHKEMAVQDGGTRVIAVTANRNFALSDNTALLYGDGTTRTLTLTDGVFHIGSEIALCAPGAGGITIATAGSQNVTSIGGLTISSGGGGGYLAQYDTDEWILLGDV